MAWSPNDPYFKPYPVWGGSSIGYTENSGSDWLGYVHTNTGGVPAIQ